MEIRAIRKQPIHISHPFIDLNLGADRTETTFARFWNVGDLVRMIGAGVGGITETSRLPTVHDLPNVVGSREGDL
uniref:Uncharacterized protein n=1 Tax=Candidatus Kentrum sp. TUN TaxID=2126343 RepID=A0A450ZM55_9GAMM|nr:MAG: hypothetical protein BECKTUN1418F_GA0071002_10591 [Candidatus Kentron sp. TUN]VFK60152.1 MAG: hypothetical protein BECKTUN1418E_GA0071001_10571 [Candidatus Kentron sp. TUN]